MLNSNLKQVISTAWRRILEMEKTSEKIANKVGCKGLWWDIVSAS